MRWGQMPQKRFPDKHTTNISGRCGNNKIPWNPKQKSIGQSGSEDSQKIYIFTNATKVNYQLILQHQIHSMKRRNALRLIPGLKSRQTLLLQTKERGFNGAISIPGLPDNEFGTVVAHVTLASLKCMYDGHPPQNCICLSQTKNCWWLSRCLTMPKVLLLQAVGWQSDRSYGKCWNILWIEEANMKTWYTNVVKDFVHFCAFECRHLKLGSFWAYSAKLMPRQTNDEQSGYFQTD